MLYQLVEESPEHGERNVHPEDLEEALDVLDHAAVVLLLRVVQPVIALRPRGDPALHGVLREAKIGFTLGAANRNRK